jgi:hypothetical protein
VTNKTFGTGSGGLRFVVRPETFCVERRFDVSGVTSGHNVAGLWLDVARLAVRHLKFLRHVLGHIVTLHTVHHLRKRECRQAGALRHRIVTSGAVDIELLFVLEVRNVREPQVHVYSGNHVIRNERSFLRESGVFDFLGRMTTAAVLGV